MATKPIPPFNKTVPTHTAPPIANQITQLSFQAHKNPLNTAPQKQARKDA